MVSETDSNSKEKSSELDSDPFMEQELILESSQIPRFRLTRGEKSRIESIQFTPGSVMTIRIEDTGVTRMTKVTIKDTQGQIRYCSSSGGTDHEYVTRLQESRLYGKWHIEIEGPMRSEKISFEIKIPFFLVRTIDDTIPEPNYLPNDYKLDIDHLDEDKEENLSDIIKVEKVSTPDKDQLDKDSPSKEPTLLDEVMRDEIISVSKNQPTLSIKNRLTGKDTILNGPDKDTDGLRLEATKSIQKRSNTLFSKSDANTQDRIGEKLEEKEVHTMVEENEMNNFQVSEDNTQDHRRRKEIIEKDNIEEVDEKDIERIRDLFIPIDELEDLTPDEMNILNENNILYVEDFFLKSIEDLMKLIQKSGQELLRIKQKIKLIFDDTNHPLFLQYTKYGEIKDNSLYYSTISVDEVPGIGALTKSKLEDVGISNITDLANSSIKEVAKISGFSSKKVVEFIVEAKELTYKRVNLIEPDFSEIYPQTLTGDITANSQLDLISGLELQDLNTLYGKNINKLEKIAIAEPLELAKIMRKPIPTVVSWIFEAQALLYNRVSIHYRSPQ